MDQIFFDTFSDILLEPELIRLTRVLESSGFNQDHRSLACKRIGPILSSGDASPYIWKDDPVMTSLEGRLPIPWNGSPHCCALFNDRERMRQSKYRAM